MNAGFHCDKDAGLFGNTTYGLSLLDVGQPSPYRYAKARRIICFV
jgi:hypothetical protein